MSSVILGTDTDTGYKVRIGDTERQSGLYILGKPGMGKSALMVNMMDQDMKNGHGLFFLDPHRETITSLLNHGNYPLLQLLGILIDIEDEHYSFGINLLECNNVHSLTARMATYTKAYNVFLKIWEENWGVWLQLILQNVLWAFIENQDYTLADVPMFLNPRNEDFRNHIIGNIKYNQEVADFWRYEFFERREQSQQERVEAALTRINTLLTHRYIRHIIGQKQTTINFESLLTLPNILLFKLSANLSEDVKKFIGTILLNELLYAIRNRPEEEREHFSIFIDEFHNFASNDAMGTMVTEGRKFKAACTFAHVERFGQLSDNQRIMGATLATASKVFFQLIVPDAQESSPEFAKRVEATERRTEPVLVISPHPAENIWDKSHPDELVADMSNRYLWIVEEIRRNKQDELVKYNFARVPHLNYFRYAGKMHFDYFDDWEYYAATPDMLWQGLAAWNAHYHFWMSDKEKRMDDINANRALEIIECLGGVYGLRPSMEPYISEPMRQMLCHVLSRYTPRFECHRMKEYSNSWTKPDRSYDEIDIDNIKKTFEYPNFPHSMLQISPVDIQYPSQIYKMQWHSSFSMNEDEFYKRLRIFYEIMGFPSHLYPSKTPYKHSDLLLAIPTTFDDLAYLHAIRELALFIGMPQRDLDTLISWRPRPLDATERELFFTTYKLTTHEPLRTLWFDGESPDDVWETRKNKWIDYYANKTKIAQQIIDVNREDNYQIQFKMIERAIWRMFEAHYFMLSCFWQVSSVLNSFPIKVPSGNYDESLRVERTQQDLNNEMVSELSNLPRFQAYAKIIQETDGRQSVATHKIQTHPLPDKRESDIETLVTLSGYDFCKKREDIETEIRERQNRWGRGNESPPQPRRLR